MKGKIYYIIPDLFKKEFNFLLFLKAICHGSFISYLHEKVFIKHKPVGGVKVMYQHCLLLQEMGYEAYPLILGEYRGDFFDYDLEIKHIREVDYNLSQNDVIVVPEFLPYMGFEFKNCTRILFNQSQSWLLYNQKLKQGDEGKNYYDLGYDYVINCSDYLCRMMKKKMDIKSMVILNGIDQAKFSPEPDKRLEGRILALSRKHPEHINTIRQATKELNCEFRIVDGLTESELIKEYQQADIFLATGYPEGFSLPPLEAMSCGCAVVGFSGGGGGEYMIDDVTALVALDGDCFDAANKLKKILTDKDLKERIRESGLSKSKHYSLENTRVMLDDFYRILNVKKSN